MGFPAADGTLARHSRAKFLCAVGPTAANALERAYWEVITRRAQTHGASSLALQAAARELGHTLLDSAEYQNRDRTNSEYVSDLYWAYLFRAPDAAGWVYWTGQMALHRDERP